MKYWLIIWILTPSGQTLFDLEFDTLIDCQRALLHTIVLQKAKQRPVEEMMIKCRPFPMELEDWNWERA